MAKNIPLNVPIALPEFIAYIFSCRDAEIVIKAP
jgi:hypothetical protein